MDWWAEALHPDLSHGDVLAFVPVAVAREPLTILKPVTAKAGQSAWQKQEPPPVLPAKSPVLFIATGNAHMVMVVSNDCELDKQKSKRGVLIAPVRAVAELATSQQETIMAQRQKSAFPLYDVPGIGDCYADLRSLVTVDRALVDGAKRLATLSDAGRSLLRAYVIDFLFRIEEPQPPQSGAA